MLAIVCPGQGSQTPGFLAPWLELPGLRERAETISSAAGLDLVAHGTVSDQETIKDTAVAQPLIVAAGLLTLPEIMDGRPVTRVGVLAGHSVGEITAACAAGVVSARDGMTFVARRARGMATASAATPTGMAAVVGGAEEDILSGLAELGLAAANVNGGGQIVAAGTAEQLEALAATPPKGSRVIPLKVAGAFHTEHMTPAVADLEAYAQTIEPQHPEVLLLSNADGRPVSDGTEVVQRLVRQVTRPVRWDACMATMTELGVTGVLELAPAGTLVGLAKRAMRGTDRLAVKTPDDLEAARAFVEEHAARSEGSPE